MISPTQHLAPLYPRSPIQVAVLLFATGGIYGFYWAYKVRRWCEATLEKPNQALWKTIALVVPIFNLFLLFDLGQLVNGACFRANLPRPQVNLPMLGLSTFFINLLWRLPDPYWFLSLFDFIPLTIIYSYMYRSQLRLNGAVAAPQKFTWFEWVIVTLGCLVLLLATFGAAVQLPGEAPVQSPWFPVVVQVMALFALFLLNRNSAAIVRDALIESKSTPSVER